MAQTFIHGKNVFPIVHNANVVSYSLLTINESTSETTEANTKTTFLDDGYFSNMLVRINENTVTASSSMVFRVNGANSGLSISIPSSTTGDFEETASQSISDGDDVNYLFSTGSTGTSLSIRLVSICFTANANTVHLIGNNNGTAGTQYNAASTTQYFWLSKPLVLSGSEANTQTKFHSSFTLYGLMSYASTNSRLNATTIKLRKNGSDGNQSISITASTTGFFQDTSNTDSVSDGDLVNTSITFGTGTETLILQHQHLFSSSTTSQLCPSVGIDDFTYNGSDTQSSMGMGRVYIFESGVEADWAVKTFNSHKVQDLWLYVDSNSLDATFTHSFRINETNSNLSLSIGAGTTGSFEDNDTDTFTNTDEISILYTGSATSGTATPRTTSYLATVLELSGYLPILGVG